MGKLRLVHLGLFCLIPACAVANVDETGAGDGDGDLGDGDMGDGDMGDGDMGDGDGDAMSGGSTGSGGFVVSFSGGASSTGGGLIGNTGGSNSGGSNSGGSSTGGGSFGGGSSGGASSGGASSGGATGSGGVDGTGCQVLAFNTNSGNFETLEEKCFSTAQKAQYGWGAYGCDGRTISINGQTMTPGDQPANLAWPGSPPYVVAFTAGSTTHCNWSYW